MAQTFCLLIQSHVFSDQSFYFQVYILELLPYFFSVKVTVQFETEGNEQNEIASNMDRLEVKL